MQEKFPVMLKCPLSVVIVDDELTWGHVRQRSRYKRKYLLIGVEGFEVGCF